jgi:membrane fusion protein, multidrug efflux system
VKTDLVDKSLASLAADPRPPRRWGRRLFGFLVLVIISAAAVCLYAPQRIAAYLPESLARYLPSPAQSPALTARRRPGESEAVPVLVATARKADVPVLFDGVGSTRALNLVTVRAQVDGKLMSVNFKEGQDVQEGFVLAEIEPTIYQAQFDQAVAKKAMDEAQLANARIDLERYTRLSATNAVARQQFDTQRALVAQLEAQVQSDGAAIENTKAVLSYTRITAPLAGRTGLRLVDPGNIVHAADTTGIVVITQIRPIAVIFTLPQQQLAAVNAGFAKGPLSVEALGEDNRTVIDRGTLTVVDNQVDQTTGTVKLKAEFPNADLQLWPGQFVNVKLLVDRLKDVVVVPSASVQRGPNGTFAYVANDDDTVTVRPVTVAQQNDAEAVVAAGIADGERVVSTGFAQLTDGATIAIGTPENLARPAGSERRRRTPGDPATAHNEAAPRAGGKPVETPNTTPNATPDTTPPSNGAGAQPSEAARERRRSRAGG